MSLRLVMRLITQSDRLDEPAATASNDVERAVPVGDPQRFIWRKQDVVRGAVGVDIADRLASVEEVDDGEVVPSDLHVVGARRRGG